MDDYVSSCDKKRDFYITDLGFCSTSFDSNRISEYMDNNDKYQIKITILSLKRSKGLILSKGLYNTTNLFDKEFLLNKNTKLKNSSVKIVKTNNKNIYFLKLINGGYWYEN